MSVKKYDLGSKWLFGYNQNNILDIVKILF